MKGYALNFLYILQELLPLTIFYMFNILLYEKNAVKLVMVQ